MQYLLLGVLLVLVVAVVSIGALGEVGLAATYGRIWGWLSEKRPKR